jgi:hypothetical protein
MAEKARQVARDLGIFLVPLPGARRGPAWHLFDRQTGKPLAVYHPAGRILASGREREPVRDWRHALDVVRRRMGRRGAV